MILTSAAAFNSPNNRVVKAGQRPPGWSAPVPQGYEWRGGNLTKSGGSGGLSALGSEYLGKYNAFSNPTAGQVEGGAAQGFFYNPTGKAGAFQSLTPSALDNPAVYEGVRNRYLQFNNDPVWLEQLNKASDTAKKGFEGSSFKLDPGVLQKMWK